MQGKCGIRILVLAVLALLLLLAWCFRGLLYHDEFQGDGTIEVRGPDGGDSAVTDIEPAEADCGARTAGTGRAGQRYEKPGPAGADDRSSGF